jgi:hypothetical protein
MAKQKSPLYIGFDVGSIPPGRDVAVLIFLKGVIK